MIVGFSGTRLGLTDAQVEYFEKLLLWFNPEAVLHGDCIGADAEFHGIATNLGLPVEVFPPANHSLRAFCAGPNATIQRARPYLARNEAIVKAADYMFCAPGNVIKPKNPRGQGTWYTINHARAQGVPGVIVAPDGASEGLLARQ